MTRSPAFLAVAVLVGAGCATKSDVAELRTSLTAELQTDRAQRDSLIAEIRQLRSVLLDSLSVQQRRDISGRGDLQRQVDDLNTALAQLIALTGETQRQLARLEDGSAPAGAGAAALGVAAAAGAAAATPTESPGDPQELYEAALRQFRRESYGTARAGLDEFLQRFPDHELAPDAQYYKAETHAEEGDTDLALQEYARVLQLYPNSRRAPTALYKSGLIEVERGNVDDARTFFSRVVQGYPDSDEAGLAERELTRLRG